MEIERLPLPGVRLVAALYSMPLSTASILRSIAAGAEVQVALLRRLDELLGTVTVLVGTLEEPARALEPGMVRLAGVLDTDVVEQMVTTMPTLVQKLQETLDALEGPVPALAQIVNQQTVGRVSNLLDRLDATVPTLNTLPGAEIELRLLRETIDRLISLLSDAQRTFGSLPGASLLLGRRGGGGEEKTDKALAAAANARGAAAAAPSLPGQALVAAPGEKPLTVDEPVLDADETTAQVRTAGKRTGGAGQGKPKSRTSGKSGQRARSGASRGGASDAEQDGQSSSRSIRKRQTDLGGGRVAGTGEPGGSADGRAAGVGGSAGSAGPRGFGAAAPSAAGGSSAAAESSAAGRSSRTGASAAGRSSRTGASRTGASESTESSGSSGAPRSAGHRSARQAG